MKTNKFKNNYYNKKNQQYARSLRTQMTKSECCLWKYVLQDRGLLGYRFRRQRPILNFIADFYCSDLKLIIELDGLTHQTPEARARDARKDSCLNKIGITVFRFTDREVLNELQRVREVLVDWIEQHTKL